MKLKLFVAACTGLLGTAAMAQVSCGHASPERFTPSWGSTAIYSIDSMSHPNGAFHGVTNFFWHQYSRHAAFESRGTSYRDPYGRVVTGLPPGVFDATFAMTTSFKNNLPGSVFGYDTGFYSDNPGGSWDTNMELPYLSNGQSGAERSVTIGTLDASRIQTRKVYWFQYPMVGSTTEWYLPARSPISISVSTGRRWPARDFDQDRVVTCASNEVMPEGWIVAPVNCAKWWHRYGASPDLPPGTLGGAVAGGGMDIEEKAIPGASRFGAGAARGDSRQRQNTRRPNGESYVPDNLNGPGGEHTGVAYC